jgi:hypothetical protein
LNNPIDGAKFTKPDEDATQRFTDHLARNRVNVRVEEAVVRTLTQPADNWPTGK